MNRTRIVVIKGTILQGQNTPDVSKESLIVYKLLKINRIPVGIAANLLFQDTLPCAMIFNVKPLFFSQL